MKKYFLTGLVIFLPLTLSLILIIFLFNFFTTPFVPIVTNLFDKIEPTLPFTISAELNLFLAQLIALILLCIFIFLIGGITRWFLIRQLLRAANAIMERIPLIKSVFKISRDILSALFSQDGKKAFQRPVLVPFPQTPDYGIAFLTGEAPEECQEKANTSLLSVFAPTAPHPISGFLLLVKKEHVHELNMTNEEAVKFLISCGVITCKEKE